MVNREENRHLAGPAVDRPGADGVVQVVAVWLVADSGVGPALEHDPTLTRVTAGAAVTTSNLLEVSLKIFGGTSGIACRLTRHRRLPAPP